jgi:exosortase F-associated protein
MSKYLRFLGVGFLFFLLILVRAFQSKLFYDPFINYFKNDYLHQVIPKFNSFKLYLNIFFRYLLNSLISIGIIYLLFQKQFLKFSLQFYAIAFVILIFLLFIVLRIQLFESYLPLFYLRRFLIHPIFILLLIPIFYYQKKNA